MRHTGVTTPRFVRSQLRTTDVAAARAFYAEVLGVAPGPDEVIALPERARAAGAPPHWQAQLAVDDVAAAVAQFTAAGGAALGPTVPTADGAIAGVRDPGGAALAVVRGAVAPDALPLVWRELFCPTLDAVWALYGAGFGWAVVDDDATTGYRRFAYAAGEPAVGGMVAAVRLPAIHPQWLHHFAVDDLAAAAAVVVQRGGLVMPAGRAGVAVCDDPQGGAFALTARRA